MATEIRISKVLVLGAGTAGLLAAISLKRKIPALGVRIVRSREIGIIGVGESTTPGLPKHLFQYLGLSRKKFYAAVRPTWKMGIHFLWGPRPSFDYAFSPQVDQQIPELKWPTGFYCEEEFDGISVTAALMEAGKAFARQPNGSPDITFWHGLHLENVRLVAFLETVARELGVEIIEAKTTGVERGPAGIAAVVLEDGRKLEADFFVDASGFRSELLGKAMEEPFVSYDRSLFCDRAILGNIQRTDEPILPYTTAETMNAGWCWQIEHEDSIHRGYVFSSRFLSDDEARREFEQKNPKATTIDHVVKFRSGRYRRGWVDNVMAVGNASGFVEPLEATALMVLCGQCEILTTFLIQGERSLRPTIRDFYNRLVAATWDEIRDFLSVHYRFNTRLSTPFWKTCLEEVDISPLAELMKFYEENGPTGLCRYMLRDMLGTPNQFGIDGFLVLLIGNRVPHRAAHEISETERQMWNNFRMRNKAVAQAGLTVSEALKFVHHPGWQWHSERQPSGAPG